MILSLLVSFILSQTDDESWTPTDYVDPFIGAVSQILIPAWPTISIPNSMLRIVPDRRDGFTTSLNNLPTLYTSHRGNKMGGIQVSNTPNPRSSHIEPDNEHMTPHTWHFDIFGEGITVDLAVMNHSAIYKFTFANPQTPHVVVPASTQGKNKATRGGGKGSYSFAYEVSPQADKTTDNSFTFPAGTKEVFIKFGISLISQQQAAANLQDEIPDFDFDLVVKTGKAIWDKQLGKIKVSGGSLNDKAVLYTSMYRVYERMVDMSEGNQAYSGYSRSVKTNLGYRFFVDDWIWDTFRAAHPLRCLIDKELELDMVKSYILMAEDSGDKFLPTFPEYNGDSHRMNGKHAIAMIWDAYVKGIKNFDLKRAYELSKHTQMNATLLPWQRMSKTVLDDYLQENGYFPALGSNERETCHAVHGWERRQSCAVSLAACFDDYCLAEMAKELNLSTDYRYFLDRSVNYRKIFHPDNHFFHPKNDRDEFIEPFSYITSGGAGGREFYDENNGWTYRWDVAHNPVDLIRLFGSNESFVKALDDTFAEPLPTPKSRFYDQWPDQSANIGQFTMANEPSLHIPYLYCYALQPWKTQKIVRHVIKCFFRNDIQGLPGDEDGGGLCGFVVLSMIGLYPAAVGVPVYVIGSPFFAETEIDVGDGRKFTVKAHLCSEINKYIQSATLNGKELNRCWLWHNEVASGGILELEMGPVANKKWGIESVPPCADTLEIFPKERADAFHTEL